MNPSIRPFTHADIEIVDELQRAYAQAVPTVKVIPAGIYLSPAFHNGQDVYCAFVEGKLVAYAPCFVQINNGPAHLPHRAWVDIKARPGLAETDRIKDQLLGCLMRLARQIVAEANPLGSTRRALMVFEYLTTEVSAIRYVTSRGFPYFESVYNMSRDLAQLPLPPETPVPPEVTLVRWKMESEAEQQAYISARNQCFPESPITLEEWRYFMSSPLWPAATMMAAFHGERLVGCASVYWNDEDNQRSGVQSGFTEDIFVLPEWRGQGIAQALITGGLTYLKEHQLTEARLAVRALNENALGLYRRSGFQVSTESQFYAQEL